MPRIQPIDPNHTDMQTAKTLDAVRKKLGVLPNIFTTFANSPAALGSYVQLGEQLARGRLTAAQRERIALAVAQENACQYCLSAHAVIGRGAGLGDGDIDKARHGSAHDPFDELVTSFALTLVRDRAELSDGQFAAAREAGLDDELMVEIVLNVTVNVMTNYLNKLASTEIDFPVVGLQSAA